jgi:D-alanyl-D-alanine dipeptidase
MATPFRTKQRSLYGPPFTSTTDQRAHRDLLREVMESHDFTVEPNEWWHFNFKDWKEYPILDIAFSDIK